MKLDRYERMDYPGLLPRDVEVWLPPDYLINTQHSYPVLYVHDGQNLFEPEKAFLGKTWEIVPAITQLRSRGKITMPIVVGIHNTPNRIGDYLPSKVFAGGKKMPLKARLHFKKRGKNISQVSDLYLSFIVEKLKPFIDGTYHTKTGQESTGIMGSSMGGLISLYALCEYPEVFGTAACLSTHWPAVLPHISEYLISRLPSPDSHTLYFDRGTEKLDKSYKKGQHLVDQILEEKGYVQGKNWKSEVFTGHFHNEEFWAKRVHIPLEFLFPNSKSEAESWEH